MNKLQQKLKEYENLKMLSEKYPDLQLVEYGQKDILISSSSNEKYNLFEFIWNGCFGNYWLKLFFIENDHEIYLCKPFRLAIGDKTRINIPELIKILKNLKLQENLVLDIISEASKL